MRSASQPVISVLRLNISPFVSSFCVLTNWTTTAPTEGSFDVDRGK